MRNFNSFFNLLLTIAASTLLFASISAAATLTVKSKDGIGNYLADDKGMALYLFKKDAPNKSVCGAANSCLEKEFQHKIVNQLWPRLENERKQMLQKDYKPNADWWKSKITD